MAISVVVLLALMFPVLAGVGMAWRSDWSSHTWLARSDGVVRLDIEVFLLTVTASAALVLTVLYVQSSGGLSQIRVPARPAEAGEKGSSDLSPLTNIDIREAVSARLAPVLVRAGLVPKENVRAPVPAAGLTLISPTDGTVIESTTVTVAFETTGIRLEPAERVAEENNHRPDESLQPERTSISCLICDR
ncbi:MAG TPA: hypothetical protein DEP84_06285 [Chloroflexi bacterium]|nr:hypothetical protein [Chloroflexota bacterium]